MKTKIFFIAVIFLAGIDAFAQGKAPKEKKEKDKVLAGKTYTVYISQTGVKKPEQKSDEISFKGGKLNSKFMTSDQHFPSGDYIVNSVDTAQNYVEVSFSSESKNPDGETLKLDGTITDDALEAKAVITNKKGKTVAEYAISGNEKEKKGAKKK